MSVEFQIFICVCFHIGVIGLMAYSPFLKPIERCYMQEGTNTSETIVDNLEKLKKKQDELIGLLKDIKQLMLELTELDEED